MAGAHQNGPEPGDAPLYTGAAHDFDFLVGSWTVRHRWRRAWLAGSTEWNEGGGTCVSRPVLNGLGNIDEYLIDRPGGAYHALAIRHFDLGTKQWSIWWLDGRFSAIGPPVRGGFGNGVGTFVGDDAVNGRPVRLRFIWSQITARSARWEQAASADGGATWEPNWIMEFTRTGS